MISLDIRTAVEQLNNGSTIRLIDVTGVADGTNFPDGWSDGVYSTHNPLQSDADSVIIKISYGGVEYSVTYTGSDLNDYLNPMIGKSFDASTVLGSGYTYFEDGIYTITVTFSGPTVQGVANPWEQSSEIQEALLWSLRNKTRQMLAEIEVPIKNYMEPFAAALLNSLFDDIYFLCQFGQAGKAQDVIDYLTSVLETQTKLTELFKNFQNYE
jgi:hypothetical protein